MGLTAQLWSTITPIYDRILEHPFYKAWAAGTLTLEDLSHYSAQYWRQVESFPAYLDHLAERLPDGLARKTTSFSSTWASGIDICCRRFDSWPPGISCV